MEIDNAPEADPTGDHVISGMPTVGHELLQSGRVLSEPALSWIENHIDPGGRIIEFGSGAGSERLNSNYQLLSIEHDSAWLNRFATNYFYAPPVGGWYDVDKLMRSIGGPLDLVIIRGSTGAMIQSKLIQCFEQLGLHCGCPVLVDDTDRPSESRLSQQLSQKGYNTYALNSDSKKTDVLLPDHVQLFCCVGTDFDLRLLLHFLTYYSQQVDTIHLILHSNTDSTPELLSAKRSLEELGIGYETWIGTFTTLEKAKHLNRLIENNALPYSWVLHADIDEHQVYPNSIRGALADADRGGVSVIKGVLVERGTVDGVLPDILEDNPLSEQFPEKFRLMWGSHTLRHNKICATRGFMKPTCAGWHVLPTRYAGRVRGLNRLDVMHYRWHAMTLASYTERYANLRSAHHAGRPMAGHYNEAGAIANYLQVNQGLLVYENDPEGRRTLSLK